MQTIWTNLTEIILAKEVRTKECIMYDSIYKKFKNR